MQLRRSAIPWFREEDWSCWCEIDPTFEPDHASWLITAMARLKRLEGPDRVIEKVIVDPEVFLSWSATYGGNVNGKARAAFAAFTVHSARRDGPV
jgi:hypothetical protein